MHDIAAICVLKCVHNF